MINEGKIKYDETYSLNKIAVELNMSRTPVRDAIQKLCEERRIDLFPSRGFRLHKMSSSEILQIYHFTMAIEGYCVICLAKAHNSEDKKGYIEKLRILLDQMKECVSDSVPFADFYRPDNEFHHVIISSLEDEHFNELSDTKNGFMTILSFILRAILFRGKRSSIITRGYLTRCVPEIPAGHITPCLSMLIRYTAIMFRKLKTHKKLKARVKKLRPCLFYYSQSITILSLQ